MRITYLFDPLCGWCYGAAPALERLSRLDGVTLQLAPTGLFAGENARPMDASFAAYAWQNDQRIARLTGQVFSDAYRTQVLGAVNGLFDSAPATLGVVAVAQTAPDREIEALKLLQHARYVDGRNNADLTVVADTLAGAGFADAARLVLAPDAELLAAYRDRIDAARADMAQFGLQGVPALILEDARGRRPVPGNILFGDLDALAQQLQAA
ncbi:MULTISPECIES: DsbA family protein [unclassified Novosphingobium]|uniref:DsbA family protein n=1 Tax=unclassified Novosphingobium TaxID=2644732 RepID=UPI0008686B67|nr:MULTISPECIES: DsbA family protein [unclassified Novosphingobium]MBN9144473.1 DsbA family protein [Novosphingobium sp.]MDR6707802.1 putative protein-disulfide isomerase [Novosphingobium sp. 1748]ODU84027.1 MAG: protein-disulfide isomerase [Novosphingobium sp. SCN 63-17]OJX93579.1 MAG: protein-disulfide isomerase [Novosphingobium sp. 63-713]